MTIKFENQALKKYQEQEGIHRKPIKLLAPPAKMSLAIGGVLAGLGVFWSVASRIPVLVQGTGILIPLSTLETRTSLSNGDIYYRFNQTSMSRPSWSANAWAYLNSPSDFKIDEIRRLSQEVLRLPGNVPEVEESQLYEKKVDAGTLLAEINSQEERQKLNDSILDLDRATAIYEKLILDGRNSVNVLEGQLITRENYLKAIQVLEAKGYATKEVVLQEQEQVAALKTNILRYQTELTNNESTLRSAEIRLRASLSDYIAKTMVFADSDIYIQEIIATPGSTVQNGSQLMTLSTSSLKKPIKSPLFLGGPETTQVSPGMRVIATPQGIDRAQYGGMIGKVVWISKLPSSPNEIANRVGLQGVAGLLEKRYGAPTEAIIEFERQPSSLLRQSNSGGYVWSSKGNPPYPPKHGDILDVEITTEEIPPISLVLPFIKKTLGFSPRYPKALGLGQ